MKRKTIEEVQVVTDVLRSLRRKVRRFNYSTDNRAAIDAQIHVLEAQIEDHVVDRIYELSPAHVRDAVQQAVDWRDGYTILNPCVEWRGLVRQ